MSLVSLFIIMNKLLPQVHLRVAFIFTLFVCINGRKHDIFDNVNLRKLSAYKKGTELMLLENALHNQSHYKLEDFFWTGSSDDIEVSNENTWVSTETMTVYSTKTILSTVYTGSTSNINATLTPTSVPMNETNVNLDADRQFWLLTVLRSYGKEPEIAELKQNLENLYKKAFQRQQAKHLGIKSRNKRDVKLTKSINVFIHKIDRTPSNGDKQIEVVYHVSVAGQPVDAVIAAEDMTLVTDDEVKQELGYPFVIKAEPYIKPTIPQGLAEAKQTWVIIGISIVIILLLLLAIVFVTICITKNNGIKQIEKKQTFFTEKNGLDNDAFEIDKLPANASKSDRRTKNTSPTYINFRSNPSNLTLTSRQNISNRNESALSYASSTDSINNISPLMEMSKQRHTIKNIIRPKAATNKTTPLVVNKRSNQSPIDTDSSSMEMLPDTIFIGNFDPGVVSPKSFLSMPSVKSFPRSNNPEPLNKVLEPVSMLHLDMTDDTNFESKQNKIDYTMFARHGSVGTSEDPGVIGPVVWNMYQQNSQNQQEDGDMKPANSVSKMRKRFHNLLDDTFSLFGSHQDSPLKDVRNDPHAVNRHSAIDRIENNSKPIIKIRPKTSEPVRISILSHESAKGAWNSMTPSPQNRPISAPYLRPGNVPEINMDQVLSDGQLVHNDPAIPLIRAIKSEINKCSLPGSATSLVQ